MASSDFFQRFYFESLGIRGEIVRLNESWKQTQGLTRYPAPVAALLGESLCATVLLSGTIKFQGSLILQIQSGGPVKTIVAQTTHQRTVRGLAHWAPDLDTQNFQQLLPDGRLVITIQNQNHEPYQGIVSVDGTSIADTLESYFRQSEQLPTRLWLDADSELATGIFLQILPEKERLEDDWNRILHLTDTLTREELRELPSEELLYRLYNEEDVRIIEPEPVLFRCSCDRERIETVLLTLGSDEIEDVLSREGAIEVHCDFCNRLYRFDKVDIGALYNDKATLRHPHPSHH
jgi:molecular chaperone Hsp33